MNKKIIGVRFKPIGKIFYFDPMEQEFTTDDKVVVETVRGLELGDVVVANTEIDLDDFGIPLRQRQERYLFKRTKSMVLE